MQRSNGTAVIALGGNALSPAGERSTIFDQFRHTRESLGPIVALAQDGWNVCIVHGNGPQVGDELVRNEEARATVEPLPLGVLVAATAGVLVLVAGGAAVADGSMSIGDLIAFYAVQRWLVRGITAGAVKG